MLARHARAVVALGEPAHASSLESALVRAGRWEEAYLMRWRRGEPSLVAAALAQEQRPALAALDADPGFRVIPCPCVDDAMVEELAASATLRELTLEGVRGPTDHMWASLGHAPLLERLTLGFCSVGTDELVAIARSTSLRELSLGDLEGVLARVACLAIGRMPRLERLSLSGSFSAPVVLDGLVSVDSSVTVVELIPGRHVASRELLATASRLQRLERLTVGGRIEPGAMGSLVAAPELRELTLSTRFFDEAELAALRACLTLRSLRLWCDEPTRLRLVEALPGVDVQSLNPRTRSPIAES
jgi:hypothetical protein